MSDIEDAVRESLYRLSPRSEDIMRAAKFFRQNKKEAAVLVRVWEEDIYDVDPEQKLCFIYVANDVLQNPECKSHFTAEFELVLGAVFGHIASSCEGKFLEKIKQVVNVWKDRNVLEDDILKKISGELSVTDDQVTSLALNLNDIEDGETGLSSPRRRVVVDSPRVDLRSPRFLMSNTTSMSIASNVPLKGDMKAVHTMISEVRSDAVIKENEFETFTDLKEKIRKMCNGRVVGEDDENVPSKDDGETDTGDASRPTTIPNSSPSNSTSFSATTPTTPSQSTGTSTAATTNSVSEVGNSEDDSAPPPTSSSAPPPISIPTQQPSGSDVETVVYSLSISKSQETLHSLKERTQAQVEKHRSLADLMSTLMLQQDEDLKTEFQLGSRSEQVLRHLDRANALLKRTQRRRDEEKVLYRKRIIERRQADELERAKRARMHRGAYPPRYQYGRGDDPRYARPPSYNQPPFRGGHNWDPASMPQDYSRERPEHHFANEGWEVAPPTRPNPRAQSGGNARYYR